MPIPAIEPYTVTAPADPRPLRWRPDPRRCALLIHDAQRYFLDAYDAHRQPALDLYCNIGALRSTCSELGIPVIYSAQPGDQHPDQRGLLADFWGKGMSGDPEECGIVPELAPEPEDVVITKWRYSAFQRTDLADALRFQGRDQLIVTGVYAHLGCLATACEAFMRDIAPFFVSDAMADFSREEHEMAVRYADRRCAAVTTTAALCTELARDPA